MGYGQEFTGLILCLVSDIFLGHTLYVLEWLPIQVSPSCCRSSSVAPNWLGPRSDIPLLARPPLCPGGASCTQAWTCWSYYPGPSPTGPHLRSVVACSSLLLSSLVFRVELGGLLGHPSSGLLGEFCSIVGAFFRCTGSREHWVGGYPSNIWDAVPPFIPINIYPVKFPEDIT